MKRKSFSSIVRMMTNSCQIDMSKASVRIARQKISIRICVKNAEGCLKRLQIPNVPYVANPPPRKNKSLLLRLTTFGNALSEWLEGNEHLQKDVKKYVQNWIKSGLIDWDITRDIPWGVPVPLDEAKGKVFYGWFDNHLAYISTAMKFLNDKGIDGKEFWNSADIYHFIGKDIVYHHYLFLTSMRLGLNKEFKLPDYIPTRGHLTLQGKKISKSRNGISD